MRYLMNTQEAYFKRTNKYATLQELRAEMRLDVPTTQTSFARAGYRFTMTTEDDGFKILAAPQNIGANRPFVGDDSGFIRAGLD